MQWKRIVLWGASFGASFAVVLALIAAGTLYFTSRAKPWDGKAIKADFDQVKHFTLVDEKGQSMNSGSFTFSYVLENHSDSDYSLDQTDEPVVMIRRKNKLDAGAKITVRYPVFVPSKQRVKVTFDLSYDRSINDRLHLLAMIDKLKDDPNVALPPDLTKDSAIALRAQELDGFVLFDKTRHYQIDFPKGW